MIWNWLSNAVLLLGARINAEMVVQTSHDSTVRRDKSRSARGSTAADPVSATS